MKALGVADIRALLDERPDWALEDDKLVREWAFPSFAEAMVFVNRIAALAEEADHHPDIDIRYRRVRLELISHDAGGLTRRDAAMVRRIDDSLAGEIQKSI
jgi:4a-hydroxytetrahydrobiopterin dehydratase